MFVADKKNEKNGIPIFMKPGDMIIYRGCDIEHWREPFKGLNHAQVFLHFNEIQGDNCIPFDNRPMLGLPNKYINNKTLSTNANLGLELDPEDIDIINRDNVNVIE